MLPTPSLWPVNRRVVELASGSLAAVNRLNTKCLQVVSWRHQIVNRLEFHADSVDACSTMLL
ncbi:MAG: hypothetical protein QNJ45_01385 [Ardenticatenaceae bacterium]|nr:hypothetical protein [Ardenticatenaceae bacterium]